MIFVCSVLHICKCLKKRSIWLLIFLINLFLLLLSFQLIGGKAEQESSDKLETSNLVLSSIGSTQTNGSPIPAEDKTFEPLDGTQVTSYNDTVTQSTFARTSDGISNPSMIFQKSVYSTLESKVDVFHAKMQTKTGALQGLIRHSSSINKECQSSLEGEDDTEYVVINLEPVTFTFEKNAYAPIQTEVVNRADKPTPFNVELIKQVSPATSLRHPVSAFEKTQGLRDVPSLAMSGQQGTKYLCASSVSREILAKEMCSLQKGQAVAGSPSPSDNSLVREALSLVKSSSYLLPREEMKLSQECFLSTQSLFSISSEETVESSQLEEVFSSSASDPLEEKDSLDCIPSMRNASDGSSELKNDKSGLNSENMSFETCNSAFTKQTSLSVNREEVSLQLSEEDSDLDLTLTISPPTSPWEEASAGEMEQLQEAPFPCLELQETAEEIIEPEEVPAVNSAAHTSMKPRESERKGDNLQTVAFILSKETCALEVAEEVHVGSDFSFSSLIEEVSPASSPDCQVPGEEAKPAWPVSPSSFKLCDAHCEKTDRSSQVETVDLAITEKENSFVGPTHPVGQDNLTQIQQMQLSAEMPLILKNHPGRKDRFLTLPGEVTEEIVPSECGEGYSFSEKVPHHDAELNQPASAATCRDSLENLVTSRNPLQPMSVENRNPHLSHLVVETSEPPFSPQKILENKSFADTFVSTTTPGGVNVSLKQQTSFKSLKENDSSIDLQTNELCYILVKSLCLDPVAGAEAVPARRYLELPKPTLFSGEATLTHRAGPSDAGMEFETQEMIVRMASLLKNNETGAELRETAIDVGGVGSQLHITSSEGRHKPAHMLQDGSPCAARALLNGGLFPVYLHADSYQNTAATGETIDTEPSSFVPKSCAPLVCGVFEEQVEDKSADEGQRAEWGSVTRGGGLDISVNSDIHYEPLSGDSDQDSFGECGNPRLDTEESCTLRYGHTEKKQRTSKDGFDSFLNLNNSDYDDWGYSSQVPGLETGIPPRSRPVGLKKEDKCVPSYVQIRDLRGIPRTYANFTVTKELRDTTRTLHSLCRHPGVTAKGGLLSSWTDTWQVADDLTQNTLDLEYLRFAHKLKQIVKTGVAPCSAPSTAVFPKEPPLQGAMGAFPATKVPESPGLPPSSRSRSPLMVTVVHSGPRHQGQQARRQTPSCVGRSSSSWKERCGHDRNHLPNSERNSTVSYHLNKLKYNSTLKESRNDISLILNEYAEFNKVMNSHPVIFQEKEPHAASGEAEPRELCPSIPRPASYNDVVADLCTSLHVKLERVVKEACTRTFLFHLVETEDKSFFVRTKVKCQIFLNSLYYFDRCLSFL